MRWKSASTVTTATDGKSHATYIGSEFERLFVEQQVALLRLEYQQLKQQQQQQKQPNGSKSISQPLSSFGNKASNAADTPETEEAWTAQFHPLLAVPTSSHSSYASASSARASGSAPTETQNPTHETCT